MSEPLKIILVISSIACCGGCKQACEWGNDFSCAIDACTLNDCALSGQPADFLTEPCDEVSMESDVCSNEAAKTETIVVKKRKLVAIPSVARIRPIRRKKAGQTKSRVQRSEPIIAYEPPLPPKFLLVPTRKVFSRVNMMAPAPRRGDVEVGYGPQLDIPGRD